jgi:large subunit ribosomal protein L24
MSIKNIKSNKLKFHIRKNDLVEIITGEERGRRGRVLEINRDKATALVEGVNLVKKHQRARSQTATSGIVTLPAPVHVSNIVLICAKCGKKTTVKKQTVDKERVRICKLCEEII